MSELGRPEQPDAASVEAAFELESRILETARAVTGATWALAADLYAFHESGGWALCGYEKLNDFLARPELGMSRSQFFRLTKAWRDLVVVRGIEPSRLAGIEPSKVQEVVPAIMRGDRSAEDALTDAETLGKLDLREKYRRGGDGVQPSGLPADGDPDRDDLGSVLLVPCPTCGQPWTPPPDGFTESGVVEGDAEEER